MQAYAIMNYSSKIGIDNKHSYEFWYYSELMRIIGDKPFARGDIVNIDSVNDDTKEIRITVCGDPANEFENIPEEATNQQELPVFMFLVTPMPLDEKSNYNFFCDENSKILMIKSSIKSNNKRYAVCALVRGEKPYVRAVESETKAVFEWSISDENSVVTKKEI